MLRIFADFDDPASFLLQQRLIRSGALYQWCAVPSPADVPFGGRDLTAEEVVRRQHIFLQTRADELSPALTKRAVHTAAAVSAYAESFADGKQEEMRLALLAAIHLHGSDISDPTVTREVVVAVMLRDVSLRPRGLEEPWVRTGAYTPLELTRLMGGTITRLGAPLTAAADRLVKSWVRQWQAYGSPALPLIVLAGKPITWGPEAAGWCISRPHRGPHGSEASTGPRAIAS